MGSLLGGILLIVGTSIGGGMLGLPIVAAELGFPGSLVLLFTCWLLILISAFLLLEVSLWFPLGYNFSSMAKSTLGNPGKIIAWLAYLLLLYALLCAYISSGSDILSTILNALGIKIKPSFSAVIFTAIFACIVYSGVKAIDQVNRSLMFFKLIAYCALVICLFPTIKLSNLTPVKWEHLTEIPVITVTLTSFGFAVLIPSLRIYFKDNVPALKKAIFIGSLAPLFCYLIWNLTIIGSIPAHGEHSLNAILHSKNTTSSLLEAINYISHNSYLNIFAKLFTGICVFTSLLGVALCLSDFLADGCKLRKTGKDKILIHILTFMPALSITIMLPNIFLKSLEYAGIYVVILSTLLPALMVWRGRYQKNMSQGFTVFGGKLLLMIIIVSSSIFLLCNLLKFFH